MIEAAPKRIIRTDVRNASIFDKMKSSEPCNVENTREIVVCYFNKSQICLLTLRLQNNKRK